ncbi:MAG TPA: hypothetical protein H9884_02230 [Candidatus Yaniella excrementigallinarum]|nr:hypothetical protein [Candidatus Yaniella excrementigallinarum]
MLVAACVVMLAGIVASLIMASLFSMDGAQSWISLTVAIVVAIGLAQSVFSALNSERGTKPGAHAAE